jgi:hypothetical protein
MNARPRDGGNQASADDGLARKRNWESRSDQQDDAAQQVGGRGPGMEARLEMRSREGGGHPNGRNATVKRIPKTGEIEGKVGAGRSAVAPARGQRVRAELRIATAAAGRVVVLVVLVIGAVTAPLRVLELDGDVTPGGAANDLARHNGQTDRCETPEDNGEAVDESSHA